MQINLLKEERFVLKFPQYIQKRLSNNAEGFFKTQIREHISTFLNKFENILIIMLNCLQSIYGFSNQEKPDKANRIIQQRAQTISIQPRGYDNTQSQILENITIETDQYLQLDNQYNIEQLDFPSFSDIISTQQPSDLIVQQEGQQSQLIQDKIEYIIKKQQTVTKKKRAVKLWDAKEDAQLRTQFQKYNGKWNEIAKHMPGRNVSQCSQRWRRLQPIKIFKRKQWTQAEDEIILELVKKHGKNWKIIASYFPNILSKKIRERYINNINPEINTGPWTEAEDATLFKLYQEYGGNGVSFHLISKGDRKIWLKIDSIVILEEFILASKIRTRLFIK
ncbi:unnamed protein product [Paramecium octaurelia]|uniref:Uncharacterized protein n=1 Tax=Paramecium octaurelia TaxID=43137 RepID=A0A8S1UPX9_PAROT|nr:unnamed protein product [Paramecium octaurelia]